MHSLLIFNPVSGKKEARAERLGKIIENLTQEGNEVTVYQTRGKGDVFVKRKLGQTLSEN